MAGLSEKTTDVSDTIDDQAIVAKLGDRLWRLDNLYTVETEDGRVIAFKLNDEQRKFLEDAHSFNIILKARQLGFTTLVCVLILDACLFNSNTKAGIIAQTLDDAEKLFTTKIKHVYDRLPALIRTLRPATTDRAQQLAFANGSVIWVDTSHRGGTLQWLLVTEFGKICARTPAKAKEIKTGAFNTVHAGQTIIVESTAEGNEGAFFEMCEVARAKAEQGAPLSLLDFKLHFFPWWTRGSYSLDPAGVIISATLMAYFERLRIEHGIKLTAGQKAFYAKKAELLGEDIYREFPSTPKEPFFTAIEGAYYSLQLARAREEGRIRSVPHESALPVITMWDFGLDDYMACWFLQIYRRELRLIRYMEWQDSSLEECIQDILRLPYTWGKMAVPHDVEVRDLVRKSSRRQFLEAQGFKLEVAPGTPGVIDDGIGKVRLNFSRMVFDDQNTFDGRQRLQNYRKQWNPVLGVWMNQPRKDINCHGADALRTGMLKLEELERGGGAAAPAKPARKPGRSQARARGGRHWAG